MEKILKNSWALFTGMGLIMIAHGFQVSLLGVRAVHESFSLTATGFMLSGYFVGYFIGAKTVPILVSRVGHIRVFAAFASIASIVVLVTIAPRFIPAEEVNLFFLLETIIGPIWVWLVVKEQPTLETIIGGAVIIITLGIHSFIKLREPEKIIN